MSERMKFFEQKPQFVFRLKGFCESRGGVGEMSPELLNVADKTVYFPEILFSLIGGCIHF